MKVGDKAPDFELSDSNGNPWKLADHEGETVLILFYPGDDTPVCTKQMCSVRDNWDRYLDSGATVVGISTDSVDSHRGFSEKYELPLTLLADEKGEVVQKYGASSWMPGKAARAEVVVDPEGKIAYHNVQSLAIFRASDDEVLRAIERAG